MSTPLKILIVEDNEDDALLMLSELRRGGYEPVFRRVDTQAAMQEALEQETWEIVTADHSMPRFSSSAALEMLRKAGFDTPFIIVSGTIGEEAAVAAMRAGASDYMVKGRLTRLVPAIERELREAIQRRERRAVDQALLAHHEQLRIARDIQQGLFPASMPEVKGYDVAGASFPAEATGGDYFDFIPMPEDQLGIVVGDVTGHGLGASLLMAEMRACLRTLASTSTDVSAILSRANDLTKADFGIDRFLTTLFARLNPRTRSLSYLNAGHPSGYVLDSMSSIRAELKSACMPLGMHPPTDFPPAGNTTLAPGDLLLFLTDGVLEAFEHETNESGLPRVLELIREHRHAPAAAIVEALCRAARDCASQEHEPDDITALVLKVDADA